MSDVGVLFVVRIPVSEFKPMESAPLDGQIMYVIDDFGNVDLAKHDRNGWTAEHGNCSEFTGWREFSIGGLA
jgi:hypothetical protein